MVILTEEQMSLMCDQYCRFPFTETEEELEKICNDCPITVADREN